MQTGAEDATGAAGVAGMQLLPSLRVQGVVVHGCALLLAWVHDVQMDEAEHKQGSAATITARAVPPIAQSSEHGSHAADTVMARPTDGVITSAL